MNLIFYDFEVTKCDWLVVFIYGDFETWHRKVVCNDPATLSAFYDIHKNDLFIGYNNTSYDCYIFKAILLGINPYSVNNWIIQGGKGYQYDQRFYTIPMYNYDTMTNKMYGLKQLEAFMGNRIKETDVPFDIDRKMTLEELKQTVEYCIHDVEQTIEVFMRRIDDFNAHINIIKTFKLPFWSISKTKAQLVALALGAEKQEHDDEWDIVPVDTLRLKKYKYVQDWFLDPMNHDYDVSYTTNVCGVPHQFGWGGLHGAPAHPIHRKGLLLHVDVTSYYPSLMIRYDLLSRNVEDKEIYKGIYDTRVKLKAEGKKAEQAPYKIILNSTYGICKDKYNPMYDPRQASNVCINGQLLLLDLLEHLEGHIELIQSNTDGLIIQIPDTDEAFDMVDDICYEWERRTGMSLGFDVITEIWQKDVNNYIFRFENGKLERKGSYVKELNELDYDLAIVNKAIVDYITAGIPIEDTINNCTVYRDFQKVVKVSGKYVCGFKDGKPLKDKTFRVFASKSNKDGQIGKMKNKNGKMVVEKFANTPEHCFIENEDINDKPIPEKLDRIYYIKLAYKRLKSFGFDDERLL